MFYQFDSRFPGALSNFEEISTKKTGMSFFVRWLWWANFFKVYNPRYWIEFSKYKWRLRTNRKIQIQSNSWKFKSD